MGGNYNFYHCTFSNVGAYYPDYYQPYKRQPYPSVVFSNYYQYYDLDIDYRIVDATFSNDISLNFYNSIIYGTHESEIYFDTIPDAGLNYTFDHCLIKLSDDSLKTFDTTRFISIIRNMDPGFINDSISQGPYDFQLDSISPAIDAGSADIINTLPGLEFDFSGNSRKVNGLPDLGAYERIH